MRTVTLERLIKKVLDESDMQNSDFVDDDTIIEAINDKAIELRGDLITGLAHVSYFTETVTVTPDSDYKVTLPTDLLTIKAVTTVKGVPLAEANYATSELETDDIAQFVVYDTYLKILGYSDPVVIHYGKLPEYLEELDDTMNVIYNEDKLIAMMAAKDIMRWEETSLTDIDNAIQDLTIKLHKVLTNRSLTNTTVTKARVRSRDKFRGAYYR